MSEFAPVFSLLMGGFAIGLFIGSSTMSRLWGKDSQQVIRYLILALRNCQASGDAMKFRKDIAALILLLQGRK